MTSAGFCNGGIPCTGFRTGISEGQALGSFVCKTNYRTEKNKYNAMNLPESTFLSFTNTIRQYLDTDDETELAQYFADLKTAAGKLAERGKDPEEAFRIMKRIGIYLAENAGRNFTADYQKFSFGAGITLFAIQLPGGGNIYLLETPEGNLMIDTGYGCYFQDVETMLKTVRGDGFAKTKHVIITHADADHCGACGWLPAVPVMHPVTKHILDAKTRGFSTDPDSAFLEKVYAQTISRLSKQHLAGDMDVFRTKPVKTRGIFPVIDTLTFGGMHFEIWESLGGHIAGQIFLYEPDLGLLFTSDALMHFGTLSTPRKEFCSVADYLISSVNADSETAKTERRGLLGLANIFDAELRKKGKRLFICCGHGDVCIIDENGMPASAGGVMHYET
jgi:glyoxylase-like metal-dependent hydrolase (beta-lactamase superfamily II)